MKVAVALSRGPEEAGVGSQSRQKSVSWDLQFALLTGGSTTHSTAVNL